MPVEFYQLHTDGGDDIYRHFGTLDDGQVVEDPNGTFEDWRAEFDGEDVDWTNVADLLKRFSGPTVVASATGDDAEKVRQRGDVEPGTPEPESSPVARSSTYVEVGGDRTFDAWDIQMGVKAGRYVVRQSPGDEDELIVTLKEQDNETVRVRLEEPDEAEAV